MYASAELVGLLEESNVMEEGIEEGGQMHRGLETTYSCELQGLEGWGEEKPKGVKACHGGDRERRDDYLKCRRIYEERNEPAVRKAMESNKGGGTVHPLIAIQEGTANAMGMALKLIEAGDNAGELRERKKNDGKERKKARPRGKKKGGTERKGTEATLETLKSRLAAIEEAPDEEAGTNDYEEFWMGFMKVEVRGGKGLPDAYTSFGSWTDTAIRMRAVYSKALVDQMTQGLGGEEASAWAMRQIAREGTPAVRSGKGEGWDNSGRGGDLEMRSAFASESNKRAEGRITTREGRLTQAGLWVARRRWRMESVALKELIGKVEEEMDAGTWELEASYYAEKMAEAARKGSVESTMNSLTAVYSKQMGGGGGKARTGMDTTQITSVKRMNEAGKVESTFCPKEVRELTKKQGEAFTQKRPYSVAGSMKLLELGGEIHRAPRVEEEGDEWIERVVSDRNVIRALNKMRASGQAAGADGWKGVLLRWASRWVQKEYARELRRGIRERNLPDVWSVRLVNLIAKKGKDETWLENRRDVWNACHGLKTVTICLNDEYVRVEDYVIRGSQSGFRANMDMAMAGTTAVLQTEETTVLCMGGARVYIDYKGFFNGIQRAFIYALENGIGVCEGVTDCVRELRDLGESAKMTTAYGLTDAFKCLSGTGQGCNAAPVRSAIQLVVTMETVHELGMGYCFTVPHGGEKACIRQALYADDLNGPTINAQGVQLLIDLAGVSAKCSGNVVGVEDKATKTAYTLTQCQEGTRVVDDRFNIRSIEGIQVPVIRETYRLLGIEMDAHVGQINSRATLTKRCRTGIAMAGGMGGLGLGIVLRLMDGHVSGLSMAYGGPTPTGMEQAEEVEVTKRKALAGMGARASKGARLQVYGLRKWGGMQVRHSYVHFAGATISHIDKALRSPPHQPHRTAMQASISLTAWIFGWHGRKRGETPLDWIPGHAIDQMDGRYTVQAYWKAMTAAEIKAHSTTANEGSGEPLDKQNKLFEIACDGGGPALWEGRHGFSLVNTEAGVVRAIDIYGGRNNDGEGRWRSWKELRKYYVRGLKSKAVQDRMSSDYNRLIEIEKEEPGELTEWLHWFAPKQEGDGATKENARVELLLEEHRKGYSCEKLMGAKMDGIKKGQGVEYKCRWKAHGKEGDTWEGEESVINHWKRDYGWSSKKDRKEAAMVAMEIERSKGIEPFSMREVMQDKWGIKEWDEFMGATEIENRDDLVLEMVSEMARHARAVGGDEGRRIPMQEEVKAKQKLEFRVDQRQQFFGGQRASAEGGRDREERNRKAVRDSKDSNIKQHGAKAARNAQIRKETDSNRGEEEESNEEEMTWEEMVGSTTEVNEEENDMRREAEELEEEEGVEDREDNEETDNELEIGGPVGTEHEPRHKGEAWPEGWEKRRPSLAASSFDEEERVRDHRDKHGEMRGEEERTERMRRALEESEENDEREGRPNRDIWEWGEEEGEDNAVVRMTRREWNIEDPWSRGNSRKERRRLYRGVRPSTWERIERGFGVEAENHEGGLRQHLEDIASGSSRKTKGLSWTKDPFIADRYAVESRGKGVCSYWERMKEQGHDLSDEAGALELSMAGASDRVIRFAQADAEWRHDTGVGDDQLVRIGGRIASPSNNEEEVGRAEKSGGKSGYELRITARRRNAVNEWACRCETGMECEKGEGDQQEGRTPPMRLGWDEGKTMNSRNSRAMAHMVVTLDEEYGFDDACAVDGSEIKSHGTAAYGIWRGRRGDGSIDSSGGSLPAGSNIQDAETMAIWECMRGTEERIKKGRQARGPRLLIVSDCLGVLIGIERAWRRGSAWSLHKGHRRSILENILMLRSEWTARGGAVVFLWTPSHCGVYMNGYADMMAKAYLGYEVRERTEKRPEVQSSLIQYSVKGRDGKDSWIEGDRRVADLARRQLGKYTRRKALQEHTGRRLIIWEPERKELWPWNSMWGAVLRMCGEDEGAGGRRGRATAGGSVRRMRSGHVGLREDYEDEHGLAAARKIAEYWNSKDNERGEKQVTRILRELTAMASAVEEVGRKSEYHTAIQECTKTIIDMRREGNINDGERWRRTRAVIGGCLPEPGAKEKWATLERRGQMSDLAGWGDEDTEKLTLWGRTGYIVAGAARRASMAMIRSAHDWRVANDPEYGGDEVEADDEWDIEEETVGNKNGEEEGSEGGEEEVRGREGDNGEERREEEEEELGEVEQKDVVMVGEDNGGEGKGRREVIRVARGTGLGNPFPKGATGYDKTERVAELCRRTHERWLEAGTIKAVDMVTEERGAEAGGVSLPKEVRARGKDRESHMTGEEQVRTLRRRLDRRGRQVKTVALCAEKTCGSSGLVHVEALLREGRKHLGNTCISGDRAGGEGIEQAEGREQGQEGSSKEGEAQREQEGNRAEEEEINDRTEGTTTETDGVREEEGRIGERARVGKERRGPAKSRAADGDVIGLVHLLRYMHGYQRPMGEKVRREMEDSKCGAPWRRIEGEDEEGGGEKARKAGGEEGEGFESETGENAEAGWEREGRALKERRRIRDETWELREHRETMEGEDEDECGVEIRATAVAAGDDDSLWEELMDEAQRRDTCENRAGGRSAEGERVGRYAGAGEGERNQDHKRTEGEKSTEGQEEVRRREGEEMPRVMRTTGGEGSEETRSYREGQDKREKEDRGEGEIRAGGERDGGGKGNGKRKETRSEELARRKWEKSVRRRG